LLARATLQFAESLVLTRRALERHLNSIFRKLGLQAYESEHINRRVKASPIFVAEQNGQSEVRCGRPAAGPGARAALR
jgi:hypothetical protein